MAAITAHRVRTAPALTLDERLAFRGLAMDERLAGAHGDMAIRTAHVDTEAGEILAVPMPAAPAVRPNTVEEVFAGAARLITVHGWITGYVGHAAVGYCLIGAIRAAAGGEGPLADQACETIWDRIRQEAPDALSPGAWNDSQSGPAPVIRILG
ncbi:hypothetical protein ACFXA3_00280 [Streptomyces sp. NPDC059456]|uniref:DUF6197 family protein n=1 Tax=Streptomyces sp. NPDC059456 TaxID=3346838 RepID=UPI0036B7F4A6